jgi:hypothetical protein
MKTTNVSEFELFINQYLANHPEVVEDQKRGWDRYWNPKGDQETPMKTKMDFVPNDSHKGQSAITT